MRLTCPNCRAQYEIAEDAIPASGRSVECSACGHVWRAPGGATGARGSAAQGSAARGSGAQGSGGRAAASADGAPRDRAPAPPREQVPGQAGGGPAGAGGADYDPAERPPLHRPLAESILSVLREEAGRELGARRRAAVPQAAAGARPRPTEPALDAASRTLPPDRPDPVDPARAAIAGGTAGPEAGLLDDPPTLGGNDPGPAHAGTAPDRPEPPDAPAPETPRLPDAAALAATLIAAPRPAPLPAAEAHPAVLPDPGAPDPDATRAPAGPPAPAAPRASSGPRAAGQAVPQGPRVRVDAPPGRDMAGYGLGLGLAAMLVLGVVAFYALAPRLAPEGTGPVAEWRAGLDEARLWLRARLDALRGEESAEVPRLPGAEPATP